MKKEKEVIEKALNDTDFQKNATKDLCRMMEEEMAKSPEKRDYRKIAELSHDYCELMGITQHLEKSSQEKIEEILVETPLKVKPSKRKIRMISVLLVAVILVTANVMTVHATNQDIVSFIVNYAQSGFSVTPIQEEQEIHLPTTPDDPYGIKGECARYGLEVEAPAYIPEGFVLVDVKKNENSTFKRISFWFQNGIIHVKFSYTEFYNFSSGSKIPSDYFNLEEIKVNGHSAITSKEDGQYSLIYYNSNSIEHLFTSDSLNYQECDKIINSIK